MFHRSEDYATRRSKQPKLPNFPTTAIGSYPQTPELKTRNDFNKGKISREECWNYYENYIKESIEWQDKLGLDVPVHGEPERTDMVEYFATKMNG